jgi:thymidylate synthase
VLNPSSTPIVTRDVERNKVIEAYTAKEKELYDSGSLLVADFAKASKFWEKLDNGDGTINSNYGHLVFHNRSEGNPKYERSLEHMTYMVDGEEYDDVFEISHMRTPYEWAKESLIKDKDSRQAIVRFNRPEHAFLNNKDFVCTLNGNFHIRDNKLNFTIVMRSNDAVKGTAFDWPFFVSIQEKMLADLKPHYPDLEIGYFEHFAHSLHFYMKDIETVKRMTGL